MSAALKAILKVLSAVICMHLSTFARADTDIWTGTYLMDFPQAASTSFQKQSTVVFAKEPFIKENLLPFKGSGSDEKEVRKNMLKWYGLQAVPLWSMTWIPKTPNDKIERLVFLPALDEQYAALGFAALHRKGQMNCLFTVGAVLCKTTPQTTVTMGSELKENGPNFFTKSGFFGIAGENGTVFELTRLDK